MDKNLSLQSFLKLTNKIIMEIVSFKADSRQETGTKGAKALRREGKIPCVLYGGDVSEYFSVTPRQVKALVYTPDFKLASIDVNGTEHKCILKDIQMHPVTDEIVHIDFLKLQDGVPVKVEIPIAFKGESPGIKGGGKLIQSMRKVKIKVKPEDLMDKLFVSIEGLVLGQSVRVRDVEVTEGVEVMTSGATPVAQVAVPRALKSATAEEEEGAVTVGEAVVEETTE